LEVNAGIDDSIIWQICQLDVPGTLTRTFADSDDESACWFVKAADGIFCQIRLQKKSSPISIGSSSNTGMLI
jgi:hypothetical protein